MEVGINRRQSQRNHCTNEDSRCIRGRALDTAEAIVLSPAGIPKRASALEKRICETIEVQIVSFGIENCDELLRGECKGGGRGSGANIKVSPLELRNALGRLGHPGVDIFVDARPFPDPAAMIHGMTRHTGHHLSIISRICNHRNFGGWLGDVE